MPAQAAESARLERIRKALAEPAPQIEAAAASQPDDRPVFRVRVERRADVWVWKPPTAVPDYVMPPMPLYHYEFMEQVTPEYFRASTLYPVGIPVGSLLRWLSKTAGEQSRRRREASAREEVRRALEDLAKAREAAGLPPR